MGERLRLSRRRSAVRSRPDSTTPSALPSPDNAVSINAVTTDALDLMGSALAPLLVLPLNARFDPGYDLVDLAQIGATLDAENLVIPPQVMNLECSGPALGALQDVRAVFFLEETRHQRAASPTMQAMRRAEDARNPMLARRSDNVISRAGSELRSADLWLAGA